MTMRVRDVMTTEVVTVTLDTHFETIASLLESHRIDQVPVIDDEHRVLGIVTEADLLAKVERQGRERPGGIERWLLEGDVRKAEGNLASEIMTRPVDSIWPEATVTHAAQQMTLSQVKALAVVDQGERLIGIVSRKDRLKSFARDDASIYHEVVEDVLRGALAIEPAAVAVVVKDGAVVLRGEVESRGLRDIIANMVGAVPGVVSVANGIEHGAAGHLLKATRELSDEVPNLALG